ncbi:hypothetical protein [Romboutsia ilealis]|jgi:hypothetical protein|uniref:hypothetical protein n=1 Tax=Romboutsia ilealis TaxID=1115758 RepID=UPI0026F4084E|nr:hypothetical protein [Romboutsia ilealis]
MPKDDYIRFRCSTDLKELVGRQAEEKGMNITDYMEYLIRKDGNNMMYVYYTEELNGEITKKITDNGNAVRVDPDEDMYLLSKTDKISVDGKVIDCSYSLEEYIKFFDGGDIVRLAGIEITKIETIETLLDMLYESCGNDKHETYAERIYNSDNPRNEIKQIINEFLIIRMDMVLSDIKSEVCRIEKQIEDGTLEWE